MSVMRGLLLADSALSVLSSDRFNSLQRNQNNHEKSEQRINIWTIRIIIIIIITVGRFTLNEVYVVCSQ